MMTEDNARESIRVSKMGTEAALPAIDRVYPSLPSMMRKYDRHARKNCFKGSTQQEFTEWQRRTRLLLHDLLGLDRMEPCEASPVFEETKVLENGIRREHLRIQSEPGVWMPMYILIPADADENTRLFICPPGHNGDGKYSVAGLAEYAMIRQAVGRYHYDYGLQLARAGYTVVCPDCRGFGERREERTAAECGDTALKGDCYRLAHMGEPLGIPVIGMLVYDLMRCIDYLISRAETSSHREYDTGNISCLGFSGGGMQTLWLAALDPRIQLAVISGYMYGYRDSLLLLNENCACNYVPNLSLYLDMGDIASLIAPRPLLIQSCSQDRLNGPRGMQNVTEQMVIIQKAYGLLHADDALLHEICAGPHQWHGENIEQEIRTLCSAAGNK